MKIVITTGGTGGHIVPAFATARCLQALGHEVALVGVFRKAKANIVNAGFMVAEIPGCGLRSYRPADLAEFMGGLAQGISQAGRFMRRFQPDRVAAFGGYASVAAALNAVWRKAPLIVHEQNVIPGRANQWLGRAALRVAVSFAETSAFFGTKKTVLTGCPTVLSGSSLPNRQAARQAFGLDAAKPTLLIFGGSQGSQKINAVFLETAVWLKGDSEFQVIHVAGEKACDAVRKSYAVQEIPAVVLPFCDRMAAAYAAADLVVARAGALTVTELGVLRKPAVLIPYPHAGNHQAANSRILKETGLAATVAEKDLTPYLLYEKIKSIQTVVLSLNQEDQIASRFFPDAAERLARTIVAD
ncbi:MAG: undecaprenyldiphospho-muramoylpentapeptide beta-N-acetylglucosaminyltransferase [Candidatus Omnitrophica bacterium]|nr:undecaprenyldiphospho-muramoylpentapeptide beta-N-acetylglucosaminyltransferase [Candidatus Omnitrophota bacterium]